MKNDDAHEAMMKLLTLAIALALPLILAGCATIEGVGRDISAGANRVSGWMN